MDKDIDIFSPHLDNVLLLPVDANQDRYNRQLKITFVEKNHKVLHLLVQNFVLFLDQKYSF